MPRATSHSVCSSATAPGLAVGAAAAPSVRALASPGAPGGAMPGHCPSALMRSSGVIGLSGVNGGVSIETFLMKTLPERANQSASFDSRSEENMLEMLPDEQPAISGATSASSSSRFRRELSCRTMNYIPIQRLKRLSHHHFAARP